MSTEQPRKATAEEVRAAVALAEQLEQAAQKLIPEGTHESVALAGIVTMLARRMTKLGTPHDTCIGAVLSALESQPRAAEEHPVHALYLLLMAVLMVSRHSVKAGNALTALLHALVDVSKASEVDPGEVIKNYCKLMEVPFAKMAHAGGGGEPS